MRGRDVAGVLQQYTKFVKPAHDTFVAPSRRSADVIIPWARCADHAAQLVPLELPPAMIKTLNRSFQSLELHLSRLCTCKWQAASEACVFR